MNPYSSKSHAKGYRNDSDPNPGQVSMKVYEISKIQHTRRSMMDNRYLIISIVHMNADGKNTIQYINLIFSSVFKLYQFLEILDKMQSDQIGTMLLSRDLKMNKRMTDKFGSRNST